MSSWLLRTALPADYEFNGEAVSSLAGFEIPYSAARHVDSVQFMETPRHMLKMNGFEYVRHEIDSVEAANIMCTVDIQFVGTLPMWILDRLRTMAYGANGAGLLIEFYDDWITDFIYIGRWANAGDFTENSIINGTVQMRLECWGKGVVGD